MPIPANPHVKLAGMNRAALTLLCVLLTVTPAATKEQGGGGMKARSHAPARTAFGTPSDVYLITIDTLRADHVGCYGYRDIRTPALDGLARNGIRFANAFTPSPITNTSHASIMTGLLPSTHGVMTFGVPLPPEARTLAEVLKEHEYVTAAFIGAVILDKSLAPGLDRGFDYYDSFPAHLPKTAPRYVRLERRGTEVVNRAENWLSKHRTVQPKFVWVHLYDPHDPYDPPPPYNHEYAGRLYDGEIAYADHALAHFLAYLKKRGDYENSTIVIVGDHGEGLGEHGEQTHGIFLYDSTTHVPLIIKLPQQSSAKALRGSPIAGVVIASQVRTLDIFPTVLELGGIALPEHLDGASLEPLWSAGKTSGISAASSAATQANPWETAFAETDYPLEFGWAPLKSVRAGTAKYIEAPRPEYYNLVEDPHETRNLYEPWNPVVQELRAKIAKLRKMTKVSAAEAPQVGSRTLEELKALGYLGSEKGFTTAAEPSLLPDPKDKIEVHNRIHDAMLAWEDGNGRAEREALENALRADPDSAVALKQLGELEVTEGRYERAAELLSHSRRIRPGDPVTAMDEAQARYAAGDLDGARATLETSQRLLGGQFEGYYLLGRIYAGLENWAKAQDQLEAAVLTEPKRPEARLELARVLLAQKNPGEALEQLGQAEQLSPRSPEVFELMAQAYSLNGQQTEARQAAARAKLLRLIRPNSERSQSQGTKRLAPSCCPSGKETEVR